MDKIYKRINWNTGTCNGCMDPNKYLYSQIARAICEAAYEKPLTVDEISLKTGIPAMFVEDELPRLINGDAIVNSGRKYGTNFIILRQCDKRIMIEKFPPLVDRLAACFAECFAKQASVVAKMGFYGADFGMERLGYIALIAVMRNKLCNIIDALGLDEGPHPPRMDGGYGWFLVDETKAQDEGVEDTFIGNNTCGDPQMQFYYLWIGKYFDCNVYRNRGICWMNEKRTVEKAEDGIIPDGAMTDTDRVHLLQNHLIVKDAEAYKLNFPVFEREEFDAFLNCFHPLGKRFDTALGELVSGIHTDFKEFVPKRLADQINVWIKYYSYNIIGFVAEELIRRGVLAQPADERPLTDGVLCIKNNGDLKI